RGGGLAGERLGPVEVCGAERVGLVALEQAEPDQLAAGAEWDGDPAAGLVGGGEQVVVGVAGGVGDGGGLAVGEDALDERVAGEGGEALLVLVWVGLGVAALGAEGEP